MSNKSIDDMIKSGSFNTDPKAKVNPKEVFSFGSDKPLVFGNNDPNVIGPDERPKFEFRPANSYPDVPPQVKNAEVKFVLPMANFLAHTLGIEVIDEHAYDKVLPALKSRALFVVLNLYKTVVNDGIASWWGLVIHCRRHPVALIQFKLRLATDQIGIRSVRLWSSRQMNYVVYGDPQGNKLLTRDEVNALVLNYLKKEGILPSL